MTDEVKCKRCNGRGYIKEKVPSYYPLDDPTKKIYRFECCLQCMGYGKINWIDDILGRNKEK